MRVFERGFCYLRLILLVGMLVFIPAGDLVPAGHMLFLLSDALLFDEDNPEAEFKRCLRQASDDDEPAEPVSLALVSDITRWQIMLTEFGLGEIHVLTRADGTVKRFSTLKELMYWAGRANLMVLYGLVSDKEERDASIVWDDQDQWQLQSWRFYALPAIHVLETEAGDIIDPFGNDLTTAIQLIQSLLNQLTPAA
uniref:Uncharacterized protein n=1 Tax=Tanacetum cinerariifolium TaxID=118510 RepID=A0A699I4Q0_TANCI|nr:hypothetical protein [Tanacetum cinerariifolium]